MAFRFCAVAGFILVMTGQAPADEAIGNGASGTVRLLIKSNAREPVTLEARHARLQQIFDALSAKTGVRIHHPAFGDEVISANCTDATLERVMECLLGSEAGLIVRYPEKGPKNWPEDIWVLNSSYGAAQASFASQCQTPLAENNNNLGNSAKSPGDTAHEQQEETKRLLAMSAAKDPVDRMQALSQLTAEGQTDGEAVQEAFQAALSDENAEVRAQAVYGLTRRGGLEAAGILQAALHDNDESVRLMAVDSAGSDASLLQQALADSDAAVRQAAEAKLEALMNEGNARGAE